MQLPVITKRGHGPRGTAEFFGNLRFRAPPVLAVAAGASELAGVLLAAGFLTPLASAVTLTLGRHPAAEAAPRASEDDARKAA